MSVVEGAALLPEPLTILPESVSTTSTTEEVMATRENVLFSKIFLPDHAPPPTLISCFFPYTKEGIITLTNRELCCDFTHMMLTEEIDIESNRTPLCGSL